MAKLEFAIFDTPIGCCGIVWSGRGVVGVQLPEGSERATEDRVQRRYSAAREAAPSTEMRRVINDIVGLLGGEPRDFNYVEIDASGMADFNRRVYDIARNIPVGSTLSYGEVAERLGDRMLAREVGQALGENPTPIIVPCHRVLGAGGKPGGFSAPGGVDTKLRLLTIEGAQLGGPTLFDRLPWATKMRRNA
jgi:methylated-DNA-[protein]-cysteine S-methyltransferase